MEKLHYFYQKYHHAIPALLYAAVYLVWFGYLEKTITTHYHVIHTDLDDYIPFCEAFIVPYLLWYVYVGAVIVYLFIKNKSDYTKCCWFLFTGMTVFLIISTLWPNGQNLRPHIMPRDNIFTRMVTCLYQTDTNTNIWPSLHVYNSLGAHLAISKCRELKKYKLLQFGSLIMCISIVLATVFLKQHSTFDVVTAFILAAIMYVLVYDKEYSLLTRLQKRKRTSRPQISS